MVSTELERYIVLGILGYQDRMFHLLTDIG